MRRLLLLLLSAAPSAFAVCTQTGYLAQADIPPLGAATFYLQPNQNVRTAYAFTTDSERIIGVLSDKVAEPIKVTLIGDAALCPQIGPTRAAGAITRAITGE